MAPRGLLLLPLRVGFCVGGVVWSSLAIILHRLKAGWYTLIILWLSCSVPLCHGAMGWLTVCDCGIPGHNHLPSSLIDLLIHLLLFCCCYFLAKDLYQPPLF